MDSSSAVSTPDSIVTPRIDTLGSAFGPAVAVENSLPRRQAPRWAPVGAHAMASTLRNDQDSSCGKTVYLEVDFDLSPPAFE